MANEVFEMVHPREAWKGSKKSFACKPWKARVLRLPLSRFAAPCPKPLWSAQPTLRMAQPSNKNAPSDVLLSAVETIKPAVISDGRMALDGLKGSKRFIVRTG
jgi:hypothetical protein